MLWWVLWVMTDNHLAVSKFELLSTWFSSPGRQAWDSAEMLLQKANDDPVDLVFLANPSSWRLRARRLALSLDSNVELAGESYGDQRLCTVNSSMIIHPWQDADRVCRWAADIGILPHTPLCSPHRDWKTCQTLVVVFSSCVHAPAHVTTWFLVPTQAANRAKGSA